MRPQLHHLACLRARALYQMAYWQWGEPANARVLVCVHGLSRQGRDFDALARRLARHYRVICPDVLGRGRSEHLHDPQGYNIPDYVADMVTLLARLNVVQVHWLGTSMGGLIGLVMAALNPTPITRLVLNDVGPVLEHAAVQRIGQYISQVERWASVEEAAQILHERANSFGVHSEQVWLELCRPMLKHEDGAWLLRRDPRIGDVFMQTTLEQDQANEALLWQFYDALSCPTLLVRGAQSDLLSRTTALAMTQRGPRAQLYELAGIGHAPMLNTPEQIDAIEAFLLS